MAGLKYDGGKPRIDLVTPEFVEGVAKVLTFGAEKYAAWNWAEGIDFSRLYASAQRHLGAWKKGQDFDEESGLSHLYHAACCLMFISTQQEWGMRERDDRFIPANTLDDLLEEVIAASHPQPSRMDIIGQNGNDGDHYYQPQGGIVQGEWSPDHKGVTFKVKGIT